MDAPLDQTLAGGSSTESAGPHHRLYEIAGVTLRVESPLPILTTTFAPKFALFETGEAGADTVVLRHSFDLSAAEAGRAADRDAGREVYRKPPWVICRRGGSWVYEAVTGEGTEETLHVRAVFDDGHTTGEIHHPAHVAARWREGGLDALTLLPSDQIVLARVFADRDACLLHAAGVVVDGRALVFVGHSDAGKSTTVGLLRRELGERLEILCDDRIVVRRRPGGFKAYGTWSHGDVAEVSPRGAPPAAILFLEQAAENALLPLEDRRAAWRRLLSTLVRPLETPDWWRKEMDVLERLIAEVPCFAMRFDRSGAVVPALEHLVRSGGSAAR